MSNERNENRGNSGQEAHTKEFLEKRAFARKDIMDFLSGRSHDLYDYISESWRLVSGSSALQLQTILSAIENGGVTEIIEGRFLSNAKRRSIIPSILGRLSHKNTIVKIGHSEAIRDTARSIQLLADQGVKTSEPTAYELIGGKVGMLYSTYFADGYPIPLGSSGASFVPSLRKIVEAQLKVWMGTSSCKHQGEVGMGLLPTDLLGYGNILYTKEGLVVIDADLECVSGKMMDDGSVTGRVAQLIAMEVISFGAELQNFGMKYVRGQKRLSFKR